jgi:hypothetical protein
MRVIYLCHPVSGDVETNLARAQRWVRWIYDHYPGIAVLCMWIIDCKVLDDSNPDHRAVGLEHDFAILERCDEIWAVGGRVSSGMAMEIAHGLGHNVPFLDLTPLGEEPPSGSVELPPLQWPKQERKHERKTRLGCRS